MRYGVAVSATLGDPRLGWYALTGLPLSHGMDSVIWNLDQRIYKARAIPNFDNHHHKLIILFI
jgi:hypothetical protein